VTTSSKHADVVTVLITVVEVGAFAGGLFVLERLSLPEALGSML
jgi:hypothetical protein